MAEKATHHARIRSHGQETWRHDVLRTSSDGRCLKLTCANHPSPTFHLLDSHTSVLLCADDADVTAVLREEKS